MIVTISFLAGVLRSSILILYASVATTYSFEKRIGGTYNWRTLKYKLSIPVWSNLPFLIPALIALQKHLFLYAVLITIAALVSLFHHQWGGKIIGWIDYVMAVSVISANLFVLYVAHFKQPNFLFALAFVALAFYFYFKGKKHHYDVYHGLWHLCSVVITLLCVLAY